MNCKYCNKEIVSKRGDCIRATCGSIECLKRATKERSKKHYEKHIDTLRQKHKEYDIAHKIEKRNRTKLYYIQNKNSIIKKIDLYRKKRKQTDLNYRIRMSLKKRFAKALRQQGLYKEKATKLYGIYIQDIINWMGPCPGNRKDYEIHHIKPLHTFDLSNEKEIQKAFAPENHMWLTIKEHDIIHRKGVNMSINIVDNEGTPIIKLDETDAKKDVIIQDGREIPLSDAVKNVKKEEE